MPAGTGPRPTALVPLRGSGKTRLEQELGAEGRIGLVAAMLDDVLAALSAGGVGDVVILAGDAVAEGLAAARGLRSLSDTPPTGDPTGPGDVRLRSAVDRGLAVVGRDTHRLVVAADLPCLSAAEVAAVLAAPAEVAVAPTAGGGTALLGLAPGVLLPTRYGAGSAGAHLVAAEEIGYATVVLDLPGARRDVDAGVDLDALSEPAAGPVDGAVPGPATATFLGLLAG